VILFNDAFEYEEYTKLPCKLIVENFESLSKTLRKLSIDTVYKKTYEKGELLEIAKNENRVIISGRKEIKNNSKNKWLFLKQANEEKQVKEIIKFLKISIKSEDLMTRCVKCNHGVLKKTKYEEVKEFLSLKKYNNKKIEQKVKEDEAKDVKELERDYWLCEGCKQVYWEGMQYLKDKKSLEQFVMLDH
jgi:uncharacterized protein with PIN domain